MKSISLVSCFALGLLLFAACEQPAQQPDWAQIKSEIQAIENAWAKALNSKDLDALMALYADDAVSLPLNEPKQVGKAAIRKSQEKDFAAIPAGVTYAFETNDVYGNDKQVTEIGTTTVKDASGKVTSTGKYIVVFEKRDGKYLCIREIYNDDQPRPAAADKSIHLFDLPKGVTEAQLSAALKEMNNAIAQMGYPGAGYFLYKTEDAAVKKYRYYFEGVWPSAEAYKEIHENQAFKDTDKKVSDIYTKIKPVEIYRRVSRVK